MFNNIKKHSAVRLRHNNTRLKMFPRESDRQIADWKREWEPRVPEEQKEQEK